jgi:NAD(P)H-hydrate epimerase
MRVLNGAQMREADRRTINDIGVPSLVLMENAGHQVVAAMESAFDELASRRVAVLCGRGNNGGDGFVIARTLSQQGLKVGVFLLGRAADVEGNARTNLDIVGQLGLPVIELPDSQAWELHGPEVVRFDLLVDAVLGTGLSKPLAGLLRTVVADINASPIPVVAVDVPTGLSTDSHAVTGEAIQAALTVTLGAPKLPLVLPPGEACAGDLVIADIGIPSSVIDGLDGPRLELVTPADVRRLIPVRPSDAHKGDFGHVLVVAGSPGKSGAACLAGLAALRSGAGLVTVATPRSCLSAVAGGAAEYMTLPLSESADGTVDADALVQVLDFPCDVIAVGPGLGTGSGPAAVVRGLVARARPPVVLDADGLTVFARDPAELLGRDGTDLVITPHPGEMGRLCGTPTDAVQVDRVEVARAFASEHRVHVVLKGARTVIATPDGAAFVNMTGNPGMATGGTGDVLTGVTAAWIGQILGAEAACQVAVYLHGLAGDLAARRRGEVALIASDVIDALGRAVTETIDPAPDE